MGGSWVVDPEPTKSPRDPRGLVYDPGRLDRRLVMPAHAIDEISVTAPPSPPERRADARVQRFAPRAAGYGSSPAVGDAASQRPPNDSLRSGPTGRAASTALDSPSLPRARRTSAKAQPDLSQPSLPAENPTRRPASVRIDAVDWTFADFETAPDTLRLLAEALFGAAEHGDGQNGVDAILATVALRGA